MNFMPFVGFYWKHGAQINALLSKSTGAGQSSLLTDIATAAVPIIKKHWPALNADSLCDDALTALKEAAGSPTAASGPGSQSGGAIERTTT
jgi:hypothetical protein